MFRSSGPPTLTSEQYARDFNEVKTVGAVNSTVRTADQTQAAICTTGTWASGRSSVSSPRRTG
ncbi:hypothetical protein [Micromonospora sp. NPDC003776]